ncbi:MAG TPA: putative quinol monooxygenase [Rhabdochlamydiaceae bacterium]|nr:putative quinol monooxygenase [Rhabdochlamydiaceae bacterium]HSX13094.1 putative quinol monooxygenase [Chlamydiales bacterium]
MELFMIARLKAKHDCQIALENELKALSTATHSEPGCMLYALHRDVNDPSLFIFIERFVSKEALEAHFASYHFMKHFAVISSLIANEPEIIYLDSLGEGKKGRLF